MVKGQFKDWTVCKNIRVTMNLKRAKSPVKPVKMPTIWMQVCSHAAGSEYNLGTVSVKLRLKPFLLPISYFLWQRNGCKLRPLLKCPDKLRPYYFLAIVLQLGECTVHRAGQGCLLNRTVWKCYLTELGFCIEYSQFKGEDLFHQTRRGPKDAPSSLTYTYGEGMKINAGGEDGW